MFGAGAVLGTCPSRSVARAATPNQTAPRHGAGLDRDSAMNPRVHWGMNAITHLPLGNALRATLRLFSIEPSAITRLQAFRE